MGIFSENCHKFWEKGIPAHPTKGKAAFVPSWNLLSNQLPTPVQMEQWPQLFGDCNIGIVLGMQAGIMVLDIDTEDPAVIAAIERVVPSSPWNRIGRKGKMLAYRYTGPEQRTFRIKNTDGEMIVECLAARVNIIVPPSIHPDTGLAYTENRPLYEIPKNELPVLPMKLDDLLRGELRKVGVNVAALGTSQVSMFVPAGARDNAMVAHAGILSRGVIRGERKFIEAMNEIGEWVESFTEKVVGDEVSREKAQKKLAEFFVRDVRDGNKALPPGWDDGLEEEQKQQLDLVFTDEQQEWTCEQIILHLSAEMSRITDPSGPEMMHVVETTLARLARSAKLKPIEIERILRMLQDQTGKFLTVTSLRKQLALLKRGPMEGLSHKELAQAAYASLSKNAQVVFDIGQFWRWGGSHWVGLEENEVKHLIIQELGDFPGARKASDHNGILATLKTVAESPLMKSEKAGLNFANGFLTEDLEMVEHAPELGATYYLPYCYEAEKANHCPMWFQLLADAWGEDPDYEEKVLSLQEAMAATLFGRASTFQRAICLHGTSGSGKSRILNVMIELMPKGVISRVAPSDFNDRFMPAMMAGKLLNICGEISESRSIAGDAFKQIVEGQPISAQHKHQKPFSFAPVAAQWFSTNHLPKSKDNSSGFTRRWLFLDFSKKVPDELKVVDIEKEIVANERAAITAWAAQAMPRLKAQNDYTLPASHFYLAEQTANKLNNVRYFLTQEHLVKVGKDVKGVTTDKQLHDAFFSFVVQTEGVRPVGLKVFREQMAGLAGDMQFKVIVGRDERTNLTATMYRGVELVKR